MSGWELGLALFGCLLAGWLLGMVTVYLYGRRLLRHKLEGFLRSAAQQSTTTSSSGQPPE